MLIFVATHSPIYFLPAISPALAEEGWGGFVFLRNNFPSSKAGTHLRAQLSLERWERGKRSCNLAIMELWLNFLLDFPMLRRVLLPTPTLTAFLTTAAAENPAVHGKKIQLYVKKNPAYMEKNPAVRGNTGGAFTPCHPASTLTVLKVSPPLCLKHLEAGSWFLSLSSLSTWGCLVFLCYSKNCEAREHSLEAEVPLHSLRRAESLLRPRQAPNLK